MCYTITGDRMSVEKLIWDFAGSRGLIAGVCGAEPLPSVNTNPGTPVVGAPFLRYEPHQRQNPAKLLPGAKSIILIGAGYNRQLKYDRDDEPRGRFSLGAVGLDYHITLRRALKDLETLMRQNGYVFDAHISVDTGPLPEKILAAKAALGWIGKHGLCISDAFGSFFNIGYMLTTLSLTPRPDPNKPGAYSTDRGLYCSQCNLCLHACPTGALYYLDGKTHYDHTRCISFLTQKDGPLTPTERRSMGTWLYGCDTCQNACPYNQNTHVGKITSQDQVSPTIAHILSLTKQTFTATYKSTPIHWRGLEVLQRNAKIALENLKS